MTGEMLIRVLTLKSGLQYGLFSLIQLDYNSCQFFANDINFVDGVGRDYPLCWVP